MLRAGLMCDVLRASSLRVVCEFSLYTTCLLVFVLTKVKFCHVSAVGLCFRSYDL